MDFSRHVHILLAVLLGAAVGVGLYTFVYAKGASYMTDNPGACANCHVMDAHYGAWLKSSHGRVAVCNDCHTPAGFVGKYSVKATNGFWHSFAFTSGWFPDQIQITERNLKVTEGACRKCHSDMVHAIQLTSDDDSFSCIRCHRSVGHLE
ncbi:MAG: cytochrome c nitrite reductase small subunit [Acidobacteria bacterium]|nr:MAG: cytochrome c nitrite reductase small subunit [Acidobacteriota bacterium]